MSEGLRPIMVLHPDVATAPVRRALTRAGYLVVISDHPDKFKALEVLPIAAIDAVAQTALETIADAPKFVQSAFGEQLARRLLAQTTSPKSAG